MTLLQEQALNTIGCLPDDAWTDWGEVARSIGRPRAHGRCVAVSLIPIEFPKGNYEQVLDADGRYNAPADAPLVEADEAHRRLAARGITVVDGCADETRKVHWHDEGWA